MAAYEVLLLNTAIPQIQAAQAGDTYVVPRDIAFSAALVAYGNAVFNENGADVDFRVEGDTDANLLFVDASTDRVGIGTNTPGYKLTVSGKISYNGAIGEGADNTVSSSGTTLILGESATWTALSLRTDGSEQARLTSSGLEIKQSQLIGYSSYAGIGSNGLAVAGNVGIGTNAPPTKLYVTVSAASTAVAGFLNTDTANGNGVYIKAGGANAGKYALAIENAAAASLLYLGSTGGLVVTPAAGGTAVFNEGGVDADFRVEGDTDANLLFVDASTDRVGIGTNAPGSKLHVSTSGAGVQDIAWINNSQSVGVGVGSRLVFTGTTNNNGLAAIDGVFAGATTADGGYMVLSTRAATSGTLTERLRITSAGTVNIVGGGTPGSTQAVSFNGSAPVDSLVLNSSGNLGVGTASPSSYVTSGLAVYSSVNSTQTKLAVVNPNSGGSAGAVQTFISDSDQKLELTLTSTGWGDYGTIKKRSGFLSAYGNAGTYLTVAGQAGIIFGYGANPHSEAARITSGGNLLVGTTSETAGVVFKVTGATANSISHQVWTTASSTDAAYWTEGSGSVNGVATGVSGSATLFKINKDSGTSRSINAAGTINASGADYAEYMTKAGDFTVAKGDVVGINADGKLTNVFENAVSFVVKSTDPSYVGGDTWGVGFDGNPEGLEAVRKTVDRIAFAGQVPVNVMGATPGQYIIPVSDNGAIKGIAKDESNMTLAEYIKAVGKVIAVKEDGRALIIVKVA